MFANAQGLALTVSDSTALDAYERSMQALRCYRGDPLAPLDEALAIAPDFASAHVAKALILMTFFERRFADQAKQALAAGEAALAKANPRERALAAAARDLAGGQWQAAVAQLEQVLVEHPRDLLALQVAHLIDFLRGDSLNLRNRVSRVLPHWPASVPGQPFVLGMHAFGLEECNQYPEAEATGRRALEAAPEDCWAVHAVTHVMEMQGRIDEGIAFLRGREADWAAPDNGFAFHNWWHLALFHIDRAEYPEALAIYDAILAGAHAMALSRLDATALLWRLQLEGADVGDRMEAVASVWESDLVEEGGFYAFNDFHAALAFAATGRKDAIAKLRSALAGAEREQGTNGEMTRQVGLPSCEAAIAFGEGRYQEAIERIIAVRDIASRFGGSHAQRDLFTLTLIEAARRVGKPKLAAHHIAERLVHKPASGWGKRLQQRVAIRDSDRCVAV